MPPFNNICISFIYLLVNLRLRNEPIMNVKLLGLSIVRYTLFGNISSKQSLKKWLIFNWNQNRNNDNFNDTSRNIWNYINCKNYQTNTRILISISWIIKYLQQLQRRIHVGISKPQWLMMQISSWMPQFSSSAGRPYVDQKPILWTACTCVDIS